MHQIHGGFAEIAIFTSSAIATAKSMGAVCHHLAKSHFLTNKDTLKIGHIGN